MRYKFTCLWLASILLLSSAQAAGLPARDEAAKAGIKTCLPLVEKLETYLSAGHSASTLSFWDRAAADKNLFSTLITLESPTSNSFANLNVLPSPDGQCVAEYTQTGYVPQTCQDYLETLGNQARFVRDMNSKTALIQGQGVQILLSPAGPNGCLWLRKEMIKQPVSASPASKSSDERKQSK